MADREQLALVLRTAVADVLGTDIDEVDETTDLITDYGVDSLELMEIGARLERNLDLRIEIEDLTRTRTVGEAVDLLAARSAGRA
ncbi:acyl carrier protein [Streptomyces corynorhini]|uniref:Acyl carrier protein n=1 Tax=Streptomyces corynorhini TaxID=2282652 RepID=A0A370AV65_9ACTN|nr:acyl carrier protein [Streptomyces corynorhini]RDG33480.1 acyl carrier protein [Streptomyces corynorhini]